MPIRCITAWLLLTSLAIAAEPQAGWSTYRGNPQRTGNIDGKAGPATPKVLWVHRSQQHHIASPVPAGNAVYVSGIGAFNVSSFACLNSDPKAKKRVLWSKTTPSLKLPTVSSPAVVGDRIIFGDGMHQTDGATLHCLRVSGGKPLWQLKQPGTLVHLEGSPTVAGNLVYIGGGAAGVVCADINRIQLAGKEMKPAEIEKILDAQWKVLLKKYEVEKKKDPDFAVPPTEDQLPKPSPLRVWQQGKEKWHVDAPVTVVGNRLLAASAFLDKEKVGDRALHCLDAKTGNGIWRTALPINPWGGASVQGNTIIVAGSNIGFDPNTIKGAKGTIAGLDLATGKEKWRKAVKAGIIGSAALSEKLAITTATDGKVRAFDITTGERIWIYDARFPIFAPPAVAGGVAYAGDLKGVLHAININDGTVQWKLDLGTDPAIKAPGMFYAGPVVHGGRVYAATCNLVGPFANKPTVVVCIGQ